MTKPEHGYPPLFLKDIIDQGGVGDVNSTKSGSGARYNSNKPDLSLIPICTLEDEARVWMYGKQKYAAWNWAKGMEWSIPLAVRISLSSPLTHTEG